MALGNLTVRLGLDAADYISGLSKAEAEAAKFVKQQERTSLAIDKQIKALQDQAATLGLSERQLKIVELAQRGATKAQLESANAALKQKEAFQEANKAISNAAAKAKATTDATAAIDKQVKALHDQVAVQGRSERQAKLYALEQAGATQEQLKSASAALKQKAAYEATTKFMRDLGRAALVVGAALGAAAIAGAVLFEKFVGKAASFQDLAEKTGASAEALASFQVAASVTNTSMDTLANLSVKLTKGLAGTDEETKQAANAIKELGLNVEDFKKLDPAQQFEAIAKRLNDFADGSGKVKFAVAAMGRSGAEALPFLKELGQQSQRNVILTAAQIKAADDYKDAQARLRAEIELFATKLAVLAIGPVQDFQKALLETAKQILGISGATSDLTNNKGIENFAQEGARALAVLVNGLDLVARGFRLTGTAIAGAAAEVKGVTEGRPSGIVLGPIEAFKSIARRIFPEAKQIIEPPLFSSNLEAAIQKRLADIDTEPGGSTARPKPPLNGRFGGGGGANDAANKAAAEAKKILDKQLSDLDNFIKSEDRVLQSRESALTRHYQNDQLSIASYFDARRAALDLNTQATDAFYAKQIKAAEDFAAFAKRTNNSTALLEAQTKIGDVQEKRAAAQSKAAEEKARQDDEQIRAARAYADQVDELRAKVLELSNTESAAAEAALIRFDNQTRALRQRSEAQEKSPFADERSRGAQALNDISVLRQREDSQTRINKLLQEAQVIEERLGTTEARLHLDRNLGLRSEITTLDLLGKSSVEAAAKLQIIADKYLAIARADGSEVLIANAEAFKQKINEMAAATDILAAKIRQTFVDTGASAIETFLNSVAEGKNVLDSFKTAFTQFANDIIRQVNRIAAENIADALFKSSSGGGSGGIFGGIADAFVSFIGGLARGEKGGPVSGHTPYIVGERGPEIFVPRAVASQATKQIDSLVAQTGKPAEYTDRVKAATVATNLPHLIGAKGPEIFVPKVDGLVIPNDKVNKLSRVLQGRADGGPVVSATPYIVGERGPEIFMPRNAATLDSHEKIVTRLVSIVQPKASQVSSNMPRVVGAPHDKVAKIASAFERKAGTSVPVQRGLQSGLGMSEGGGKSGAREIVELRQSIVGKDIDIKDLTARANSTIKFVPPQAASAASGAALTARRREIFAPLAASRTIMRDEKIITRYANAPYSRPVAAHVPSIGGRDIPKPAKAAVQRDEAINKLSTAFQKQGRGKPEAENPLENRDFMGVSTTRRHPPYRAVAELALDAPRQRRVGVGPAVASTPYVAGERGREIFIPKSASAAVQHDEAVSKLSTTFQKQGRPAQATRIINERQIYIQESARAIRQSKRDVAELVANAPRQRRADGGPVEASTPYVVGELGPELFMPKSAERVINHEKAIDDLVSNKIQHRATNAPKVTYLGEQGHEIFISKLASTNIKNEKFISDLVSKASVKNERVQNDLVSNTRNEKIINQLVSNQRAPFAAHQTYLIHEREIPKSVRKVIADDKAATRVRSPLLERRQHDLVSNTNVLSEKLASTNIKNEKFIDLVSNTVQRRAIGSPITTRTPYIVDKFGAEVFMPKAAANQVQELRNVRGSHYGLFPALELGLTSAHTPLRALNFKETDHVSIASSRINKNEMVHNDLVSNTRNEKTINQLVSNIQRRTELESYGQKDRRADNSGRNFARGVRPRDGGLFAAHQTYLIGERRPELVVTKSAEKIIKNENLVSELVTNNAKRNEKVINDLVSKTAHYRQSAETNAKIIKNENLVSELVTNNARRNEKVINDLVSKTVHHREIAGSVAAPQSSIPFNLPRSDLAISSPNVAAKIIKNESRISELVSNDVQRNEEIINRLATTTRRESGRSNQLLIIGANGPELFIPKAAGSIVKNERRINELVSNIEHRNIDRSSEKTIDEIIASTVQRRAQGGPVSAYQKYRERVAEVPKAVINSEALRAVKRKEHFIADIGSNIQRRANGGPVSAYQQYLVGERGPELYVPRDKPGGIKVPSDFFTNEQHHRAFGGPVAANRPFIVGEHGPEWFVPKTAGTVVANSKSAGMGNPTFIFNMSGGGNMNRQTQQQLFADAAQAFARSSRRLN